MNVIFHANGGDAEGFNNYYDVLYSRLRLVVITKMNVIIVYGLKH